MVRRSTCRATARRNLRSGAALDTKTTRVENRKRAEEAKIQLRKRQRRLTANTRVAQHQQMLKKRKANIDNRKDSASNKKLAETQTHNENFKCKVPPPVQGPPEPPPVESSDCPCSECQEESEYSGYVTSGTSVKKKPGKRIRWRNAIKEDDKVRQDLHREFQRVVLTTKNFYATNSKTKQKYI